MMVDVVLNVGTIASLIWLAVGFDLTAENSPQMTMYEGVVGGSYCAGYRWVQHSCHNMLTTLPVPPMFTSHV